MLIADESKKQSRQVFLCYSRDDSEPAERIYTALEAAEFSPWMDTRSLDPGERWKLAITQAIDSSQFCILLLSRNSVDKVGFVQSEIKYILEKLREYPPGRTFLLPASLDNCRISEESLKEIHRVDLAKDWDEGVGKLISSMEKALGKEEKKQQYEHYLGRDHTKKIFIQNEDELVAENPLWGAPYPHLAACGRSSFGEIH